MQEDGGKGEGAGGEGEEWGRWGQGEGSGETAIIAESTAGRAKMYTVLAENSANVAENHSNRSKIFPILTEASRSNGLSLPPANPA